MTKLRLGKIFLAVFITWLGTAAAPALADNELIMTTLEYKIPGTAAVLRQDFIEAIEPGKRYVDARWYVRRLAARTNLCIAYAGIGDYESAVKWCDAAMQVNRPSRLFGENGERLDDASTGATRASWIARNNRAVLHLLMGEISEGHQMLEATERKVYRKLQYAIAHRNHLNAEYREALAQTSVEPESLLVKSGP